MQTQPPVGGIPPRPRPVDNTEPNKAIVEELVGGGERRADEEVRNTEWIFHHGSSTAVL